MAQLSQSNWRNAARPIIARVLEETRGEPEKIIKARLLEAYPFGQRQYHPYKIWCDEIARQRGKKPPLGTLGPRAKKTKEALVTQGQGEMF